MSDDAKQIQSLSFRCMRETPVHVTYGIWVNGWKSGDLIIRQNERESFEQRLILAGFKNNDESAERRT